MWHSRRSYFVGIDLLLEVVYRDVAPHITRKIDENGVYALKIIEKRRKMVVMFNLCGREAVVQTQILLNKLLRKMPPIVTWIGDVMRIKITRCSSKFCRILLLVKAR